MPKTTLKLALAFTAFFAAQAHAEEIVGVPRIVSGRALEVAGQRVVLAGMDTPDPKQTCETADGSTFACGEVAKQVLGDIISGGKVACAVEDSTADGDIIGSCRVWSERSMSGRGEIDVAREMVRRGWAVARYIKRSQEKAPEPCPQGERQGLCKVSDDRYLADEAMAVRGRHGLWGVIFDLPWVWRRAQTR